MDHEATWKKVQCNLDYPDLVYPEPQLSGYAQANKYTNMHAQSAWPWVMTFWGCGNSCSRCLAVVKADLCACMNAADLDHPIDVSFQDRTL